MAPDPDADPQVPANIETLAVAAHEYFTSLRTAGFRVHEALYLTAALLSGGVKPPAE